MALVIAISLGVALGASAVQVVGRNADVTLELPYTQLLIALSSRLPSPAYSPESVPP